MGRFLNLCVLLCAIFGPLCAQARQENFFFLPNLQYLYTHSAADTETGATFTQKYQDTVVADVALGMRLGRSFFLGLRSEYWFSRRNFSSGGALQIDQLSYYGVGADIGYLRESPRVYYLATVGAFYPLHMNIRSRTGATEQNFTRTKKPVGYQGRIVLGIRMSSLLSFSLMAGYRYANLGKLNAAGVPYLSGNQNFDLSGIFFGAGLGFSF